METTIRTCDICKKQITNFDTDKTLYAQNGEEYFNLQKLLYCEYKIDHACLKCIIGIAASIDGIVTTMKEAQE